MTQLRRLSVLAPVLLGVVTLASVVGAGRARAHEPARETFMNAFVKLERGEAHLVIRVPLRVLEWAKFPLRGREIDLAEAEPAIERALAGLGREITITENGQPLRPVTAIGRLTLPSDRSFEAYDEATEHVRRPPAPGTTIYADQGYVDAHLTYAIGAPRSRFTIQTAVRPDLKDYLKLTVRYLPLDGESHAMVITRRSGAVSLDPQWHEAAAGFTVLGITHILGGVDHLLFLLCLIIPLREPRTILAIVTAFTVGHSVTLLGSAYDLSPAGAWFPPFVETAIAASIVYMALENIVGVDLRRRWLATSLFGLVHGFGFSYALKENLQFAGRHRVVSLLAFNIGIELGQVLVLALMLPALAVLLKFVLTGRVGVIVLSALIANVGWDWMIQRGDALWRMEWPALDAGGLASLARWVAGVLLAAGAASFVARRLRSTRQPAPSVLGPSDARGGGA